MKKKFFLLFIFINFVRSSDWSKYITCTKSFGLNPLRMKLYSKSNSLLDKIESTEDFKQKCLLDPKTSDGGELSYVPSSNKKEFLHVNPNGMEFEELNVFVLDFQMINNDIVHVNFLDYEYPKCIYFFTIHNYFNIYIIKLLPLR